MTGANGSGCRKLGKKQEAFLIRPEPVSRLPLPA